jgi:hypothetical protein
MHRLWVQVEFVHPLRVQGGFMHSLCRVGLCPCHLLQNDVWFTVIRQELMT